MRQRKCEQNGGMAVRSVQCVLLVWDHLVFLSLNIYGNINVSLCEWLTELELTVHPSQTSQKSAFVCDCFSIASTLTKAYCFMYFTPILSCSYSSSAFWVSSAGKSIWYRRLICILTGIQYRLTCHSSSHLVSFHCYLKPWCIKSKKMLLFKWCLLAGWLTANPSSMFKVPQHSILSRMFCSICKAEPLCGKEDETSNAVLRIEIEFYTRVIGTAMTSLLIV